MSLPNHVYLSPVFVLSHPAYFVPLCYLLYIFVSLFLSSRAGWVVGFVCCSYKSAVGKGINYAICSVSQHESGYIGFLFKLWSSALKFSCICEVEQHGHTILSSVHAV